MKRKSTLYIVQGALIAAIYATMTILQNILIPGSASMPVQFRVSEVLTVLALYTPAAIPGLTIGCVIANISSLSVLGLPLTRVIELNGLDEKLFSPDSKK